MENSRIAISIQGTSVEAEGSEEFVERILQKFESFLKTTTIQPISSPTKDQLIDPESPSIAGEDIPSDNPYPNLLHLDHESGKVKILKTPLGNSKKDKATKLCLIYMYGMNLLGTKTILRSELINCAKEHAVFDQANFSTCTKNKEFFIEEGKKGTNKQIKLTLPGKKQAETILDSMK